MSKELTIDIHGLFVEDALERVQGFIDRAPLGTEKIVVVHGYNRGTALRDAIRHRLYSPRIRMVEPAFFNDGETYVWLKR
ncbi:MAG: Smr/MutS family protein [Bacteroidales bacterium]|nr:Smr/MutS family protein [Bacteroidales bacterium]